MRSSYFLLALARFFKLGFERLDTGGRGLAVRLGFAGAAAGAAAALAFGASPARF
jgi:hypothetical protein